LQAAERLLSPNLAYTPTEILETVAQWKSLNI
jgi:hypothetical protein